MSDQMSGYSPESNGRKNGGYTVTPSGQVRVRLTELAHSDAVGAVANLYRKAAKAIRKQATSEATSKAEE